MGIGSQQNLGKLATDLSSFQALPVNHPAKLMTIPSSKSLSYEAGDPQLVHEDVVLLLASREQLGGHIQVRFQPPRLVEHVGCNMQRSGVAVVQSQAVKDLSRLQDIRSHVIPKEWRIFRTGAVSQLHRVSPGDQLSAQVDLGDNNLHF